LNNSEKRKEQTSVVIDDEFLKLKKIISQLNKNLELYFKEEITANEFLSEFANASLAEVYMQITSWIRPDLLDKRSQTLSKTIKEILNKETTH